MKIFKVIILILIFTIFSCDNFDLTEEKVEENKENSGSRYVIMSNYPEVVLQADNFITQETDYDFGLSIIYMREYHLVINYGEVVVGSKKKYFISVSHLLYKVYNDENELDFKTKIPYGYLDLVNVDIEFLFGDHTTPMRISRSFVDKVLYETDLYDINHDFNIRTLKFDIEYKDMNYDIYQNTHDFTKTVINKPAIVDPTIPVDIVSTDVVEINNSLILTATNTITLKDGFHAKAGSSFCAKIQ